MNERPWVMSAEMDVSGVLTSDNSAHMTDLRTIGDEAPPFSLACVSLRRATHVLSSH